MSFIQTSINQDRAAEILKNAHNISLTKKSPSSRYSKEIEQVIHGSHLTYRYILVTNLLAKSVNPKANAIALQASAPFDGAFDSRSLCHNVIVPFDRTYLHGKLGRSNEPYLNKPARFPALTLNNAVRKGNDSRILQLCIHVLSSVSHEEAVDALVDALFFIARRASNAIEIPNRADGDLLHAKLVNFSEIMLESSNEGENCVLISGLSFHLLAAYNDKKYDVRVHPTNQAGSSSNEILDIDVYENKTLIYTAEVKDKIIESHDIDHASIKVASSGYSSFFFLVGPRGDSRAINMAKKIESKHNVKINVINVRDFFISALGLANDKFDLTYISESINNIVSRARFKDTTMDYIRRSLKLASI